MSKKQRSIFFSIGLVLTVLWLWGLFDAFGISKIFSGIRASYLVFGWFPSILFLLTITGVYDSSEYSGHTCDVCTKKLKKGEGKHWPGKGSNNGCYCACDKCLPNVIIK